MSPARQLEFAFEDAPRWDEPSLETTLAREAGKPIPQPRYRPIIYQLAS